MITDKIYKLMNHECSNCGIAKRKQKFLSIFEYDNRKLSPNWRVSYQLYIISPFVFSTPRNPAK